MYYLDESGNMTELAAEELIDQPTETIKAGSELSGVECSRCNSVGSIAKIKGSGFGWHQCKVCKKKYHVNMVRDLVKDFLLAPASLVDNTIHHLFRAPGAEEELDFGNNDRF